MDHDGPGSDDVEFLDIGPKVAAGRGRRRGRRWLPLLIAGVLVAVVIVVVTRSSGTPSASPGSRTPTQSAAATGTSRPSGSDRSVPRPVRVTDLGHPMLGVTKRWELFARGDGLVIRIQLAHGRITRTTVPALASSGPVSFVVGVDQAIVRPIDNVPGYVVPDGRPALRLSARLSSGGVMFPGPDPNHVWMESQNSNRPAMALVALDAGYVGPAIRIPVGSSPLDASPDGAGGLVFPSARGFYDFGADGLHRVTTAGSVLATGRTGWLALDCNPAHRCATVVIDRTTGRRRVVATARVAGGPLGAISPDGTTAAVYRTGTGDSVRLYLLDLGSGRMREVDLPIGTDFTSETLAWAPDGRWLFVIDETGRLDAVDGRTGTVGSLGASLPHLDQLAIRDLAS